MIYAEIKTKDGNLGTIVFVDEIDDAIIELQQWVKDNNLTQDDVEEAQFFIRETNEHIGFARYEGDGQWTLGKKE